MIRVAFAKAASYTPPLTYTKHDLPFGPAGLGGVSMIRVSGGSV